MDPDDHIRAHGAAAFQKVIDDSVALVDMLWMRAVHQCGSRTPEQKAAVEAKLNDDINRIQDPTVRFYYRRAVREKIRKFFRDAGNRKPALRSGAGTSSLARKGWSPPSNVVPLGILLRDGGLTVREEPGEDG